LKQYLLIMLSIIIFIHIDAMEEIQSTNLVAKKYEKCLLSKLPTDILDLIAQLLPCRDYETEKEFVERTLKYKKYNSPHSNVQYQAFSPDNALIIYAERLYTSHREGFRAPELSNPQQLHIFDRRTDKIQEHVLNGFYQKLAISSDGNLFATIYSQDESGHPHEREDLLTITNLSTKEKESYSLHSSFEWYCSCSPIAFNKQGTHIIAHSDSQYKIFTLTINTPNQNADHKKTFAKYCVQQGICKNITQ
jgi:hypothetical protein